MRRRRVALAAAIGVAIAVGATSPRWAPPVLRKIGFFSAERVEVSGTRLLAPHEVIAASGVRIGVNVWTDPAAWEAALRRHPVVADAEVTRRLPGTLRIRVTEKRPAALVNAGILRPVTAEGEILPVDAARAQVDLPLLQARVKRESRRVDDRKTRAALAEAGRLTDLDPALMARVSEVRAGRDGEMRLLLSSPAAEVIVPAGVDEPRLVRLRVALDDVARRMTGDTLIAGRARLDARFEDQIVVHLPGWRRETEVLSPKS